MKIDCHVHIGVDPLFYVNGWSPYALDLEGMLRHAEGTGIDHWIVFPFVSYLGLDMEKMKSGEIAFSGALDGVPYRFENRRLLEEIYLCHPETAGRAMPFLMADPGRHPVEQVQEWRSLPEEFRIYGVKIQATIIQSPIAALLDEARCMLDFAEENNLPFLIHSSIDPTDKWSPCADILRVVESRPGLRFILAHSCRFDHASLRRVAELPNAWFDCAAHVIHCECALKGLPAVAVPGARFPSDYRSPETVMRDLAEAFPDKLIWGSDAPFYSYADKTIQLKSSYAREVACLDALPADLRDRVCRRNTLAWLKGT
jgi:predicted TIM-barrel fold metal-dependent hydrolase